MIKKIILYIILIQSTLISKNIYEKNCLYCHNDHFPTSLQRMFMSYLKVYSGEITLKSALKGYLKNPTKEQSVMSDLFIERFGIKERSTLSDKELEEAIDIYWNLYNVRNRLK